MLNTATGVAPIFVDAEGENMIVVVLGANSAIAQADIDAAAAAIARADVLMTQLEINLEMVEYALEAAREQGIHTILNPAPAAKLPAHVLALADYITPNETELETLSGQSIESVEGAARSLLAMDDQTFVVTMGKQGAQVVRRDGARLIGAYDVDVVDTTGAGDAFNGGLAVALAEGKDLDDAIAFANATCCAVCDQTRDIQQYAQT